MPLINGTKMACEPCIRGHRSTKCTHADERLMVPVRKPGRPLSSCPHPSSRTCSCAAVTAAIPKRQKCHCGPSATQAAEVKSENNDNVSDLPPTSPTKPSTSAFRVQKSANKITAPRKPSLDQANLERMDPAHVNVVTPTEGRPKSTSISSESVPSTPGPVVFNPFEAAQPIFPFSPQPMMFPYFQQPVTSPPADLNPPKVKMNGTTNGKTNGTMNGSTSSSVVSSPGGCCGGANGSKNTNSPTATSNGDELPQKQAASCCSSRAESAKPTTQPDFVRIPGPPTMPNNVMIPQFRGPMMMPNGMYPYYPHPTIFTYPPQYGSYLQPLQPDQWRQFMALTFGQYHSPEAFGMGGIINGGMNATMTGTMDGGVNGHANGGMNGGINGTMNGSMPMPMFVPPDATMGTSHQCGCGEGCQCIGCAAHPYNEATQNYIRSAWNSMAEDAQTAKQHPIVNHEHSNGEIDSRQKLSTEPPSDSANTHAQSNVDETLSPPIPPSPSDGASGAGDEQTLSASDFFFVSYSLEGSCSGETAGCPCGDDCQCIGCVIHSIPDPTESTTQDAI